MTQGKLREGNGEHARNEAAALYLDQTKLAQRWGCSPRTLERWRWQKQGPRFLKIGGHVRYRAEDIEAFEATQLRGSDWIRS